MNLLEKENLPKPTTQVEEIVWHKYPEEKPKKIGTYLRTIMAVKRNSYVLTDWCKWLSGGWYESEHNYPIEFITVAWAELPKGWRE